MSLWRRGDNWLLDPSDAEEYSEGHREYLIWLDQKFGLGPPEDLDALWTARKEHDDRFRSWASRFIDLGER